MAFTMRAAEGALVSIGSGLFMGLLLELGDPVIVSADPIESATGLRLLGAVARIGWHVAGRGSRGAASGEARAGAA